jgi:hypothetical protein
MPYTFKTVSEVQQAGAPAWVPTLFLDDESTGWPKRGLVSAFRLADADPDTAALNDVTEVAVAPVVPASGSGDVASSLTDGGLRLKRQAYLQDPVTIDITAPWTRFMAIQVLDATAGLAILAAIGGYPTNGFAVYSNNGMTAGAGVVTNSLLLRQSVNGITGTFTVLTNSTAVVKGKVYGLFLSHDGAGKITVRWRGGGDEADGFRGSAALVEQVVTVALSTMQGAAGAVGPNQRFRAGAQVSGFLGADLHIESAATWNVQLTKAEETVAYENAMVLAAARSGRVIG